MKKEKGTQKLRFFLCKLICQDVRLKLHITAATWVDFSGGNISHVKNLYSFCLILNVSVKLNIVATEVWWRRKQENMFYSETFPLF